VIERASTFGSQIELLTYNKVPKTDWPSLYPETVALNIAPHFCNVQITPTIKGFDAGYILRCGRIRCFHGTDFGSVSQYVEKEFQKKVLVDRPNLFSELEARAKQEPNGQAIANVRIKPDLNHPLSVILDGNGYLIDEVLFGIHIVCGQSPLAYSDCHIKSHTGSEYIIPLAEATVGGKRLVFVLPSKHNPNKLVLKIDSAHQSPAEKAKNKKQRQKALKRKAKHPGK
jgi:hypothetical protein